jgi:hypothetical protein
MKSMGSFLDGHRPGPCPMWGMQLGGAVIKTGLSKEGKTSIVSGCTR